ncbi:MAG: fatty acid desaturase [Verrucomicrobiota bacterium]
MISSQNSENHRDCSQAVRAGMEITEGIEAEIKECHQLCPLKRVREFLCFAALYLTGMVLTAHSEFFSLICVLGIILMGVALNSLGIFIHEGLHGVLAKHPVINGFVGFLCGLPLLVSASAYRVTHRDHHLEFGQKLDYGTYRQHLEKSQYVWIAYCSQLFLGSILYILFIPLLAFWSASIRERSIILMEYAVIFVLAGWMVWNIPANGILLYWFYPSLILMVLSNIRGLASHALGDTHDIYLSSRTVKSSPLVSMLFLHENYHLEHHLFPQVPSYHLKRVHELVWKRLPKALYAKSYTKFLIDFLQAARNLELAPLGMVQPAKGEVGS